LYWPSGHSMYGIDAESVSFKALIASEAARSSVDHSGPLFQCKTMAGKNLCSVFAAFVAASKSQKPLEDLPLVAPLGPAFGSRIFRVRKMLDLEVPSRSWLELRLA
jgi:hypothetical protein